MHLLPVGDIAQVAAYEAVVFGSGVFDGSWPADAATFVPQYAVLLETRPVWLFTVGSFGDRHERPRAAVC